jgi:imidazolonepropionase-like amidohydrolase
MRIVAALVLTSVLAVPLFSTQDKPRIVAIRAAKIFTAAEKTFDHGVILVEGGKIKAVGNVEIPDGAEVLEFPQAWATPGLIDLHCHIAGAGLRDINEMVHPLNPELSTRATIDPDSELLRDALAGGVTTVNYIPGSGTNISGFGTLMHTGGGRTIEDLIIRFPGAMKVAQAWNPERMGGDLGMSRMGMWWGLRQVLDEARAYNDAWTAHEKDGKPRPKKREDLELMRGLFQGKWPVIIHTADARDVMATVRIFHDEYRIPCIVSHGEFGGYKSAPEIAKRQLPANIGPRTYDWTIMVQDGRCYGIASKYFDAGVKKLSINTDSPVVPEEELIVQAAMSVRLGLSEEAALRAVTIEPAKAILIDQRLGSLEAGKDADIVIWSGNPLDVRNRPLLSMIGGKVAYDERRGRHVTFGGGW